MNFPFNICYLAFKSTLFASHMTSSPFSHIQMVILLNVTTTTPFSLHIYLIYIPSLLPIIEVGKHSVVLSAPGQPTGSHPSVLPPRVPQIYGIQTSVTQKYRIAHSFFSYQVAPGKVAISQIDFKFRGHNPCTSGHNMNQSVFLQLIISSLLYCYGLCPLMGPRTGQGYTILRNSNTA